MAELFNILKITVDEDKARVRVLVNPDMPLRTSEDIEATARVYYLAPAIAKHVCLGDAGSEFQDCMGDTEIAHLLEHLTVEIMNETGLAGDISCGRTRAIENDPRAYEIELSCPDDALTIGSLSSAIFMMDWAFLHADMQAPDLPGTVEALRRLVLSLRGEGEDESPADEHEDEDASDETGDGASEDEAGFDAGADEPVVGGIDVEGAANYNPDDREDGEQPVFGGAAAGYTE